MPVSTLLLVLTLAVTARHSIAQQQPGTVPATVVLPAQAVIAAPPTAAAAAPTQQPPGTFSAAPQPATAAAAAPGAELKPPLMTAAPLLPPVGECEALDEFIKDKYAEFFILSRLINAYTLKNMEPSMPLNSSYAPLTILAPSNVIQFLIQNNVNIKKLAASPLQTILFAPTVAGHFLRGYFPANALPIAPVPTLCGAACGDVQFIPGPMVRVQRVQNPSSVVNITKPNAALCPGEWVVHEVSGFLYANVTDPLAAAAPALDLSYALGGQWDTFAVTGP